MKNLIKKMLGMPVTKEEKLAALTAKYEAIKEERRKLVKEMNNG